MNRHKSAAVRRYDFFKFVVAFLLIITIGVLALRRGYLPLTLPLFSSTAEVDVAALTPTASPATETSGVSVIATPTAPVPTATPTVTAPSLDTSTIPDAEGQVTLRGTGVPGSRLQVVSNDEVLGEVTVAEDGTWSYQAMLSPGEHQLQVRALDDAGEVAATSNAAAVAVPTATPELITAPTLDTPAMPDAEGTVMLEGTGTPGSRVEVVADDEVLEDVTVGEDGAWSYQATLSPGEHQLQARALDEAGEVVAASDVVAVTVPEATPLPGTALTLAAPTEPDAEGRVTLRGTGAPSGTVQVVVDGEVQEEVTVEEDGTWSLQMTLSPGEHQLQARALDDEGEVIAESEEVVFSQPELTVQTPVILTPTQGITLTAGVITIAGTGSPSATLEVLLDGEVLSTTVVQESGAWAISSVISPGVHSLVVQALDDPERLSESLSISVEAGAEEAEVAEEPPSEAEDVEEGCGVGEIRDDTYIVAPCEYIALIAERAGVTVEALLAANPDLEDPNLIYPGQVLNLPLRD
jgi:archaellum component FlaG (FlaF/FlaG flagellin family)/nucleoid-associated protein YgaU